MRFYLLFLFLAGVVFTISFLSPENTYSYYLSYPEELEILTGRLELEESFCEEREDRGYFTNYLNFPDLFLNSPDNINETNEDTGEREAIEYTGSNYFYEAIRFANAPFYLNIPTYEGSGQEVHPDLVYFPQGWHGYKYWMVFTPYPWSKRSYENPSLVVSQGGFHWEVPGGLKNPIVKRVSRGYNADPDLIYNPQTDELWMYFMQFKDNRSYLYRVRSTDGINWTAPELILWEPFFGMLSPSIVYKDGIYHLWYVDSGWGGINAGYTEVKYRQSQDGVNWSEAEKVNISIGGIQVWHLEVNYIPSQGEFWMFFPGFSQGSVANRTDLYFARAKEPTDWIVYANPVLTRSGGKFWDNTRIYQASFLYDAEKQEIQLWYSAAQKVWKVFLIIPYPTYQWRIGYTSFRLPLAKSSDNDS